MLGDYVLHFPLTDFAVSLLAVAALLDVGRLVLKRATWTTAVDLLLAFGFLGALGAVGSGLWLVSVQGHGHDELLSMHHWFAYGTLAAASASVLSRLLQNRIPAFAYIKTLSLVIAAVLVTGAGFYGGKMAHPVAGAPSHHGETPRAESAPHEEEAAPHHVIPGDQPGAMTPGDAMDGALSDRVKTPADATTPAAPTKFEHEAKPHAH